MTPYDADELKDDVAGYKDGFNYHLSSCRIFIECAFGELVMRWGRLWRTLLFNLKKCARVVQVCMLLHNFIIDCKEAADKYDAEYFETFDVAMDSIQREITRQTGEIPRAIVTDNNEPRTRGRPSVNNLEFREQGAEIRHQLTIRLASCEMKHPLQHDMHYNSQGHMFMTG
jgi:hypothetical protein